MPGVITLELSFAVAAISLTLTKIWVTQWLRNRLDKTGPLVRSSIGYLFTCPYCMSHWVSAFVVALVGPEFRFANGLVSYGIQVFAIIGLSALLIGLINQYLLGPYAQLDHAQRQIDELTDDLDNAHKALVECTRTHVPAAE